MQIEYIKVHVYRKVSVNDRSRLNNVPVIKHQRHANIQNVHLYQHRIASQRKGQIVISRYGCEMKPLSSSAWASGTAGLTAAWPPGAGGRGTRHGLRQQVAQLSRSVTSASTYRPTGACQRLVTPAHVCFSSPGFRPTDSYTRLLTPTQSPINSTD